MNNEDVKAVIFDNLKFRELEFDNLIKQAEEQVGIEYSGLQRATLKSIFTNGYAKGFVDGMNHADKQ